MITPPRDVPHMSTKSAGTDGENTANSGTGDPWVDAYLKFRRAVLDGGTVEELTAFAAELKRGLPPQPPPPPAAMFIHHDIIITCGTSSLPPQLATALWIPGAAIPGR